MYQALFKVHTALLEFIELAIKFIRVCVRCYRMNFLANPIYAFSLNVPLRAVVFLLHLGQHVSQQSSAAHSRVELLP